MPKFILQERNKEEFFSLIGKLTTLSTIWMRDFTTKKPNTSFRELQDEPEIISTIKTRQEYLRNITGRNEEKIWVSVETANKKCFSIQSVLQKTMKTKSGEMPLDMGVDKEGDLLYCDLKTRTVYKVKNDQTEEIITLHEWIPSQLCSTSFGNLLVTMFGDNNTQSKVIRYSGPTVKCKTNH